MPNISTQLEVGVKAFIRRSDGKFLVLQRAKPYPDSEILRWDIPGGRIVPGEEMEQALEREIREETGLKLKRVEKILAAQDILRVEGKHTVRITFLAKATGEVKIDPQEHIGFRWANLSEMKKLEHDIYLTPVLKILTRTQD